MPFTPLQIREVFHLCFLRLFLRRFEARRVTLKGGVNLRLFFQSPRYSEDMDLDVVGASLGSVQKNVMAALAACGSLLRPYGVTEVRLPTLARAKQTETTQRFKIHLLTESGLDLFTKLEFSRRGRGGEALVEYVPDLVLRPYRLAPLVVPHYAAPAAFAQKVAALAGRAAAQARDVFDLHQLLAFLPDSPPAVDPAFRHRAMQRLEEISFVDYRDTVVAYLAAADQSLLADAAVWQAMKDRVEESLRAEGKTP